MTTVITADSPDHALHQALLSLASQPTGLLITPSRNGDVVRFPGPVITEYADPTRRISWSDVRDANPFLHYIESAWMLAGRRDVATVAALAKNMANYSDDGETLFGAYGHRWRHYFGYDQLAEIIAELRRNPTSRRCVLQMWDGRDELRTAIAGGKDVCCNVSIYFDPVGDQLNMTVSNRSNDLVWGAYGANVVHMSVLHEYVAAMTGFELGTYYQFSNNLHFYLNQQTEKLARVYGQAMVVSPVLTDHDHLQEELFTDVLDFGDSQMRALIEEQLVRLQSGFIKFQSNGPKFIVILSALITAFQTYKALGARVADEWIASELDATAGSLWMIRAQQWLRVRPSYAT